MLNQANASIRWVVFKAHHTLEEKLLATQAPRLNSLEMETLESQTTLLEIGLYNEFQKTNKLKKGKLQN